MSPIPSAIRSLTAVFAGKHHPSTWKVVGFGWKPYVFGPLVCGLAIPIIQQIPALPPLPSIWASPRFTPNSFLDWKVFVVIGVGLMTRRRLEALRSSEVRVLPVCRAQITLAILLQLSLAFLLAGFVALVADCVSKSNALWARDIPWWRLPQRSMACVLLESHKGSMSIFQVLAVACIEIVTQLCLLMGTMGLLILGYVLLQTARNHSLGLVYVFAACFVSLYGWARFPLLFHRSARILYDYTGVNPYGYWYYASTDLLVRMILATLHCLAAWYACRHMHKWIWADRLGAAPGR